MSIVFSKLIRQSDIQLQDKTVSPSTSTQEVTSDRQYYGLSKVTVNPMNLQEKSFSLSSNGVTRITPDDGYDGISAINLSANISGGEDSEKYLNMIRGMMNFTYKSGSGGIEGTHPFSITPDIFLDNMHEINLDLIYNSNIISVEIPEGIDNVDLRINHCPNLKYVENLSSSNIFYVDYNSQLKYVNLQSEHTIKYGPFSQSNMLNHIVVPDVYTISAGGFGSCPSLKVIDFRGKTDSRIPSIASSDDFRDIPSDCKVVIPDSLYSAWTNWGTENRSPWYSVSQSLVYVKESEYETDGLTYELSSGNYGDNGEYVWIYTFTGMGSSEDMDITIRDRGDNPNYRTVIGYGAFGGNTDLLHVHMPSYLYQICSGSFAGCTNLKSIDFTKAAQIPSLDSTNAFENVPKTCKFIIPSSLYDSWIASSGWNTLHNEGYNFVRAN